MRVAVIVDDLDPARRRRSFWEERLAQFPNADVEHVSLLAQMNDRKFFNVYQFDIVIFNWCVLDGALMYGSDRVQQIVEFFDDHFRRFVRQGNLLIMENQPKRWHPSQRAYEVLFKTELRVKVTEGQLFGDSVVRNQRLSRYPLFQHLPTQLNSNYPYPPAEPWFPPNSTSQFSLDDLHPTKMYSGGFRRWKSTWLPVLLDKDGSFPVMLVKTDGLGLYVASTMYLASSNNHGLLDSFITGWAQNKALVLAYHARQGRVRFWNSIRLVTAFIVAVGVVVASFATHIVSAPDSFGGTILGDIIVSVAFGALVVVVTAYRRYLGRLVRAIRNR